MTDRMGERSPQLYARVGGVLYLITLFGEVSLCLWLLVKGVNVERCKAKSF